ncbi:Organic solvent tolerance protein [Jannaschia seosinensis]|uniref:LPS-assembly protein LptD n=1 Tax=Jannaschia seosinensis TaxID=313367 RepID=A0A0M7BBR7_9RHOB|nr:LPS assembly protein LptD [Jannaschia seosinensis]CUH39639.1 Organic solvent tolerance protein [Jannaschia seosinensis]
MRALRLIFAWLVLSLPALAQEGPATLVADRIDFDQDRLVASGKVEIFADGRILRADRITYLRDEDRVIVDGDVTLIDGPDTVLVADYASLSADLRNSVVQGARLVLDRRLQISATEAATGAEGRYTELYQTVASSCTVCAENPVPLWQIRARRIVHDKEEGQLYFEGARFEVAGVPVAWLPTLRLPDPTVMRSRGLLAPRFTTDDQLGTGVTLPYFIPLGPSRDITLSPFVTNREARALGFRYRQAFDNGAVEAIGALATDQVRPDETRGYLFADGTFALPRDYRLDFDLQLVTDDTYLLDYGIDERDRLESSLSIGRIDRDDLFVAEIVAFNTLRADEQNRYLPTPVLTVERTRRVPREVYGGQLIWTLQAHARRRAASEIPADGPDNAARDVRRLSAGLDWRRSEITADGFVLTGLAGFHLDTYHVTDDPTFEDRLFARAVPYAGLEVRLPLARRDPGGVRHVIEPVAQVILAPTNVSRTPNEDSLTPEFDEGNLFSPNRFPGRDTRELGNRLNAGVSYTRYDPTGWNLGGTVGRVWRAEDLEQFRDGTGLGGTASDWLVSVEAEWRDAFLVMNRSLFSDAFSFSSSETILRWSGPRHALSTRYTWLDEDVGAERFSNTGEWEVDAAYDLARDWTGRVNWRYDFVDDEASRAGLGLTYRSDCVTVDFDVERRFTSSDDLEPTTRFGLGVELAGFGADDRPVKRRRCGL